MNVAFGGDPAMKADLLARLETHAAAGQLRFGVTHWDGNGGSPLGVSIEGSDSGTYATRYGYPLALAALLDPLTAQSAPESALADTLRWVECVEPGADLSSVPRRIVEDLLVRLGADDHAPERFAAVCALHDAEAEGRVVVPADWSKLRGEIEQDLGIAGVGSDPATALAALAASCWPLRSSRSVLTALVDLWSQDVLRHADPDFSATEGSEAMDMLDAIFVETRPQRDAGEVVDIPAIFRSRMPDLSRRFEAHVERSNRRYAARSQALPALVIGHLAKADGDVPDRSVGRDVTPKRR